MMPSVIHRTRSSSWGRVRGGAADGHGMSATATAADRHPARILVVDDERSIRELLAIVLRREGYEVLLAENGRSAIDTLEREHDNLRAALRWLLESSASEQALRLCVALARFWTIRGYVAEGRAWLQRALALVEQEPAAPTVRAKALSWAGWLAELQGETAIAVALCQESLDLSRHLSDQHTMALTLNRLGIIKASQGDGETVPAVVDSPAGKFAAFQSIAIRIRARPLG